MNKVYYTAWSTCSDVLSLNLLATDYASRFVASLRILCFASMRRVHRTYPNKWSLACLLHF